MSEVQLCLYLISYASYREEDRQPSTDKFSIFNHSGTKCRYIQLHYMDSVTPIKEPLVTHWLVERAATLELLRTLEVVRT